MSQENVFHFNWNVRGLNARAKQDAIKLLIQHTARRLSVCKRQNFQLSLPKSSSTLLDRDLHSNMLHCRRMAQEVEYCLPVMKIISISLMSFSVNTLYLLL